MAKTKVPLSWTELDPDTLNPEARSAYDRVRHLQSKLKASQTELEKLIAESVAMPDTHRLVFSYKFGHLSVAIDVARPKNASPNAINFETLKAAVRRGGP